MDHKGGIENNEKAWPPESTRAKRLAPVGVGAMSLPALWIGLRGATSEGSTYTTLRRTHRRPTSRPTSVGSLVEIWGGTAMGQFLAPFGVLGVKMKGPLSTERHRSQGPAFVPGSGSGPGPRFLDFTDVTDKTLVGPGEVSYLS